MFNVAFAGGLLPVAVIVFFGLCLLVSAVGFRKFVYFISIGYGYSIAAMAIASVAVAVVTGKLELVALLEAALLAFYGVRLGTYLAVRERSAHYRASQTEADASAKKITLPLQLVIWVSVAVLYVMMFMPCVARFSAAASGVADPVPALSWIGLAIMAAGLVIEAVADLQKNRAKKAAPDRFCNSGLYRLVRCPNYFGETLVWTGNLLVGAALLSNWLVWLLSAAGYVIIVLIMKGSARSLELKQEKRYGADPAFQAYVKKVPILVPFLPIYSFRNAKIYLG